MTDNDYMRTYMKRRYWERRELALALLGGKCAKCPSKNDLEVDHKDSKKKTMSFERMTMVSMEKFMKEISGCQILCDRCHNKKTVVVDKKLKWARGTHGTLSAYRYCKCDKCKAAKAAHWQKHKSTRLRRSMD